MKTIFFSPPPIPRPTGVSADPGCDLVKKISPLRQRMIEDMNLHVLPPGFHKVRFYGFFSPSYKKLYSSLRMELATLNFYRSDNSDSDSIKPIAQYWRICPNCKAGKLRTLGHIFFKKNIFLYCRPPPNENIKSRS